MTLLVPTTNMNIFFVIKIARLNYYLNTANPVALKKAGGTEEKSYSQHSTKELVT